MNGLYMMVTIIDRSLTRKFTGVYEELGLDIAMIANGVGTASSEILDYFGLQGTEKSVLFHVVTGETWKRTKRELKSKLKIEMPGMGIAFLVPMSSIGGKKALNYLTSGQEFIKGEETTLKETKYELLVVIANQGYTQLIMDAARKVRASGGTVIHAKGTGSQRAEKFMGVSLVPEKEIVFIVVRSDRKNDVMRAIMDHAGVSTKAGSIVFSLPVTDTAGMRLMEEQEEEE